MGRNLQTGRRLRPVDLAREHGLSTQAVRNYEEAGILPPAERTAHGYRAYTPSHAAALRAFLALVPGHGHGTAAAVMRAVNEGAEEEAFRLVDESHAQLLEDRRTLHAVEEALRDLEPLNGPQPKGERPAASGSSGSGTRSGSASSGSGARSGAASSGSGARSGAASSGSGARSGGTFIGPLARRLGVRPATLRTWERAGLVRPRRDPVTGYRVYDEADVRDARLAHQLRRGGYPLERIALLLAQVRSAGGLEPLGAALADWHDRLTARGRAMLAGAAALDAYLRTRT